MLIYNKYVYIFIYSDLKNIIFVSLACLYRDNQLINLVFIILIITN